jgi:hypothetical protein
MMLVLRMSKMTRRKTKMNERVHVLDDACLSLGLGFGLFCFVCLQGCVFGAWM